MPEKITLLQDFPAEGLRIKSERDMKPFWKVNFLEEMSREEWEALRDGAASGASKR